MNKLVLPRLFCCQNPLYQTNKSKKKRTSSFDKAVALTHNIQLDPSNQTQIQLYSLFKQATEGDVNIAPPDSTADPLIQAQYDAWLALKGKTIKAAQAEYIKLVKQLGM